MKRAFWIDKVWLFILASLTLVGCSTLNFSANHYSPPSGYLTEVKEDWGELTARFTLKYNYTMDIVTDIQCQGLKGIPEIQNTNVRLPDKFVRYIYQNYYQDRFKVLSSIFAHEICHVEYGLPSSPPQVHFQTDQKAIEMLRSKNICSGVDYYKSLFVLRNYWFARKGVGGHAFNIGWNILQVASLVYAGSAHFVDWFATDLDKRLQLIARQYKIKGYSCFKRSQGQ